MPTNRTPGVNPNFTVPKKTNVPTIVTTTRSKDSPDADSVHNMR